MRYLSQEEIAANTDHRGVVNPQTADLMRQTRAVEPWERYDSIVIGPGAADKSRGWFNTWAEFAAADQLQWFGGRDSNVGPAYTNQLNERTDWAQDLWQTCVELIAPPGIADLETDVNDAEVTPLLFTTTFANQIALRVVLAESDEVAKSPVSHFPAGFGTNGLVSSAPGSTVTFGGNNGDTHVSNSWKWPDPITLAAKAKLTVFGQIDAPIRQALATLSGPGSKQIPNGPTLPNWYVIRITFRGPRYLQLRGARSSA